MDDQRGRCRRLHGQVGLLGAEPGCLVVGDDFGLERRLVGSAPEQQRAQRALVDDVGDVQVQGLAGSGGEVGGVGRQVRGLLEGDGGRSVLGGHAVTAAGIDHGHLAHSVFAGQFHLGLGRCCACGRCGHQCGCGHGREETLFHVDSCMHLIQVRV